MRRMAAVLIFASLACGGEGTCPAPGSVSVSGPASAKVGDPVSIQVAYSTPRSCVPNSGDIDFDSVVFAPDGGTVASNSSVTTVNADTESISGTVEFTPDAPGIWVVHGEVKPAGATAGSDAGTIDAFDWNVVAGP